MVETEGVGARHMIRLPRSPPVLERLERLKPRFRQNRSSPPFLQSRLRAGLRAARFSTRATVRTRAAATRIGSDQGGNSGTVEVELEELVEEESWEEVVDVEVLEVVCDEEVLELEEMMLEVVEVVVDVRRVVNGMVNEKTDPPMQLAATVTLDW